MSIDKGSTSGTPSWEVPKEWESTIEQSSPVQQHWQSARGINVPRRAQVRPDNAAQTMVQCFSQINNLSAG